MILLLCRLFGHRPFFEVMHDRLLVPPYRDYTRVVCERCGAIIWDLPRPTSAVPGRS